MIKSVRFLLWTYFVFFFPFSPIFGDANDVNRHPDMTSCVNACLSVHQVPYSIISIAIEEIRVFFKDFFNFIIYAERTSNFPNGGIKRIEFIEIGRDRIASIDSCFVCSLVDEWFIINKSIQYKYQRASAIDISPIKIGYASSSSFIQDWNEFYFNDSINVVDNFNGIYGKATYILHGFIKIPIKGLTISDSSGRNKKLSTRNYFTTSECRVYDRGASRLTSFLDSITISTDENFSIILSEQDTSLRKGERIIEHNNKRHEIYPKFMRFKYSHDKFWEEKQRYYIRNIESNIYFVNACDIDVSEDGLEWYHMLGIICYENLPQYKLVPYDSLQIKLDIIE